jgi:hypothetical protein
MTTHVKTSKALAAALGISKQLVSYHQKNPKAPKKEPEGHPVEKWREYLKQENRTATQSVETKSARERVWHWKAEMAEMEAKQMRGDLITKDSVRSVVTQAVMSAKTRLIGSQATLAAQIGAAVGGDVLVVQEKIAARDREVLELLASGKWFKEDKEK